MAKIITKEKWVEWQLKNFCKAAFHDACEDNLNYLRIMCEMKDFVCFGDKYNIITDKAFGDTRIINMKTGKIATAKLHDGDISDMMTGLAVAWAKYCKRTVPKFYELIDVKELKPGDIIYVFGSNNFREPEELMYIKPWEEGIIAYDLNSDIARKYKEEYFNFYKNI